MEIFVLHPFQFSLLQQRRLYQEQVLKALFWLDSSSAFPASQGTVSQPFCVPDMSLDCWQMHFPPWLVSWPTQCLPVEAERGYFNARFSSLLQRPRKLAQKTSILSLNWAEMPWLVQTLALLQWMPSPSTPWSWSLGRHIIACRSCCQPLAI